LESGNDILLAMEVVSFEFNGAFLIAIDKASSLGALTSHFDYQEEERLGKLVPAMSCN
jgi:hypothetical protein